MTSNRRQRRAHKKGNHTAVLWYGMERWRRIMERQRRLQT